MTIATSKPRVTQLSESERGATAARVNATRLKIFFYEGVVRHRRFSPVPHGFRNRLTLMFIDLDEIDSVFGRRFLYSRRFLSIARFHRSDYLGDPARPLADCVRETVFHRTGRAVTGPIHLLTHVRYIGFVFNPISVYYCYNASGDNVDAIVAEVTNTPWGERHSFVVLAEDSHKALRDEGPKDFHVSPFLPMALHYRWRVSHPDERAAVCLECHNTEGRVFDATLVLKRRELTAFNRLRSIVRFPMMSLQVVIAIYWQAFRLWMKRAPFFPHPVSV